MANDFKRYTKANVNTSAGASATAVYTVPSTSSVAMETIVIGITLANTSTAGVTSSVFIDNYDGSNDVYLVKNATVPAGSSLEVMAGNKLVLQGMEQQMMCYELIVVRLHLWMQLYPF